MVLFLNNRHSSDAGAPGAVQGYVCCTWEASARGQGGGCEGNRVQGGCHMLEQQVEVSRRATTFLAWRT